MAAGLPAQDRDADTFQVAIGLIQRGLHEDAAQQLERFLAKAPKHPLAREANYRLGVCKLELKQPLAAIEAMQRALQNTEGFALRAECRYRLGHALKERGQHKEAGEQFAKLVAEDGTGHYLAAAALFAEGECHREAGQGEQALRAFVAAAEHDNDPAGAFAAPALYAAGFLQLHANRPVDAATVFAAAAERFPKHAVAGECRYLAGEAFLRAKQLEPAEKAFAAAQKAGGEYLDEALIGLARCKIESGKDELAQELLKELVRRHADSPHVPRARLELARILHRAGKHDLAARAARELLERELELEVRLAALELCGLASLEAKDLPGATAALEQAITLAGTEDAKGASPALRARLHYALGECCAEQKRFEEALEHYRQAARSDDPALRGDAVYGEALALHRLERFEPALERIRALLAEGREHRLAVHARFAEAENLFALKRYPEAAKAYAAIEDGDSVHALAPKARFKRAWCVYLQGKQKDAAAMFAALAAATEGDAAVAEEALSMQALALHEAGDDDGALAVADRYRARYQGGAFLARTERVASRILKARGDPRAAAERAAAAAKAERQVDRSAGDRLQTAELLLQAGDFDGARKAFAELNERPDATGARAWEGLAWCAFELGDDEGCQRAIERALAHPEVKERGGSMYELLATLHHRAQRWDAAATAARQGLEKFPGHARAADLRYALGSALARAGKDAEARPVLEECAAHEPRRPDRVQYELGWVCKRLGDVPAFVAAFQKVIETSKDEDLIGEARLHVGEALLEAKKTDEGRRTLAAVKGKHQARALYRLGASLLDEGKLEQAGDAFEQALAAEPGPLLGETLYLAGECRLRAGDAKRAAPHLRRVVEELADHERAQAARQSLGRAELLLAAYPRAAAALSEWLRRDDGKQPVETARSQLWLGQARSGAAEHAAAEAAFTKATELSDGELAAEAQYRLGLSRKARGEVEGAIEALLKLTVLYAHEEWVSKGLLLAAACYEERGQNDRAKKFYDELLQRFPNSEAAGEARARQDKTRRGGR